MPSKERVKKYEKNLWKIWNTKYKNICVMGTSDREDRERRIFHHCCFKSILCPFFSLFSFWDSHNVHIGWFNCIPEVPSLTFLVFFSLLLRFIISNDLFSSSQIVSSAYSNLLLIPLVTFFNCLS